MKKFYLLIVILFFAISSNAQDELFIHYSCNLNHDIRGEAFTTFTPSIHTERVVNEILNSVGLDRNFTLLASDCEKVLATTERGERYILYNPKFINRLFTKETKWEVYAALAHAIGHHLNSHIFTANLSKQKIDMELKADEFVGAALYDLGVAQTGTSAILENLFASEDSTTHPSILLRTKAVDEGWQRMYEIKKIDHFAEPNQIETDSGVDEEARKEAEELIKKIEAENRKLAEAQEKLKADEAARKKAEEAKIKSEIGGMFGLKKNGNGITKTNPNSTDPDISDDGGGDEMIEDPSMRNFLNAKFPFPPPDCNSEFRIPGYVFSECKNLGDVADKITKALEAKHYPHRFLSVPNGFVIVTQMEQYNIDGTLIEDSETRWVHYPKQEEFSWSLDYFSTLVFPKKGFLRVFAFVITSESYAFEGRAGKKEVESWHQKGVNKLPIQIANIPYSDKYHDVNLLTYEFEVPESDHKAQQRCPCCKFQAYEHLKYSTLVDHIFK